MCLTGVAQDTILRKVDELTRVMLRVVYKIDTEYGEDILYEDINKDAADIASRLFTQVEDGRIKEAMDSTRLIMKGRTQTDLLTGLMFHSYLANLSEEYLDECGITAEDVRESAKDMLCTFGLEEWADMFLYG